jgi:hypothetical protein
MSAVLLTIASALVGIIGATFGDLVSEEVRRRLDRVPMQLTQLACRRLPEPVRTDRADEWSAELNAILIRRGATKLPITRLVVGVRFALGLFIATPAIGRASQSRRSGRVLRTACAAVAIALTVPFLIAAIGVEFTMVIADALLVAIIARIVLVAIRLRDSQTRSAAVALLPFAAVSGVDIAQRMAGSLPIHVSAAAFVGLMLQPLLTLRFANQMGRASRAINAFAMIWGPIAGILGVLQPRPLSPNFLLLVVGPTILLQLIIGSVVIASSIRRRLVDERLKLIICGVATTLFGITLANLLLAAAPAANPNFGLASRMSAATAAFGYLLIVAPPRWIRLPWGRKDSPSLVTGARTIADN